MNIQLLVDKVNVYPGDLNSVVSLYGVDIDDLILEVGEVNLLETIGREAVIEYFGIIEAEKED